MLRNLLRQGLAGALLLSLCSVGHAADATVASIRVYPQSAQLTTVRDLQRVIVQAVQPDGITRDVTHESKLTLTGDAARLEGQTLYAAADGKAELTIEYGGHAFKMPIDVARHNEDPPISFKLDVMPIFMKSGCNTGSCHGAARGKDGFRLSLFGFDAEGDYHRLTREIATRRINLAVPAESLLMQKGAGQVPHTGGKRFAEGDELYGTLMRWLNANAPADQGEVPTVDRVEIYPENAVLDGEGASQHVIVRAFYSDGTDRDVTSLAYFSSNNENSAEISQQGEVTAANPGEAFIMARFDTHTVGTHFIVLPKDQQFTWNNAAENNYIDTHVHAKLRKLRINPSEVSSDEQFLRRVSLDITGKMPTVEEYHNFMTSTDPKKRELLVDDLLGRKEFVELWVMKWAELLQIRSSQQVSYKSMLLYYNWLEQQIAGEVPVDKMVQNLLGSNGGTFANPATNYYQNETDTLKVSENVAQVFMGMRIQCAQCHNHPFDRWTMDDYYSFAAFFSQIGRKRAEDPRELIVYNRASGEVANPVTKKNMAPKFLGGAVPDVKGKDRRVVMAQWLASSENPYFATNLANIVWAHFLGRGIINEVDDVRVSNPASNPELLQALADKFTEYNYDFKRLVRDICLSRTYQLSTQTNETNARDERNFSHAPLRRLRAEVLLDVISQVTDTKNKFRGLPNGARAVQIADGNTSTYFLTTFGRATRETVCACEVKMEPNLSQALHLLNGDTLHGKIAAGKVVTNALAAKATEQQVIEDIYIRCLCRRPTEQEVINLQQLVKERGAGAEGQGLEDVFWAVLNSREFLFNH
ncbi:MAG: DUF1553 domain-containing protein [Planctomycetales bacterium]|nr:DUF1553 domain-containing protein [Planctomycetales bacterium]